MDNATSMVQGVKFTREIMANINYCDNTNGSYYHELQLLYYNAPQWTHRKYVLYVVCPLMIFACCVSMILNAGLMIVTRQSRLNKKPVVLLSMNLALTDLIASLCTSIELTLTFLDLFVDKEFPSKETFVSKILALFPACRTLKIQILKQTALSASALHLLALAALHYNGIRDPLHRAKAFFRQHLERKFNILSIILWLLPLTILIVLFHSYPCQAFDEGAKECEVMFVVTPFYKHLVFSFYAVPFLLMMLIYGRIFYLIKQHQKGMKLDQPIVSQGVLSASTPLVTAASPNLPQLMEEANEVESRHTKQRKSHRSYLCPSCSKSDGRVADQSSGESCTSALSDEISTDELGSSETRRFVGDRNLRPATKSTRSVEFVAPFGHPIDSTTLIDGHLPPNNQLATPTTIKLSNNNFRDALAGKKCKCGAYPITDHDTSTRGMQLGASCNGCSARDSTQSTAHSSPGRAILCFIRSNLGAKLYPKQAANTGPTTTTIINSSGSSSGVVATVAKGGPGGLTERPRTLTPSPMVCNSVGANMVHFQASGSKSSEPLLGETKATNPTIGGTAVFEPSEGLASRLAASGESLSACELSGPSNLAELGPKQALRAQLRVRSMTSELNVVEPTKLATKASSQSVCNASEISQGDNDLATASNGAPGHVEDLSLEEGKVYRYIRLSVDQDKMMDGSEKLGSDHRRQQTTNVASSEPNIGHEQQHHQRRQSRPVARQAASSNCKLLAEMESSQGLANADMDNTNTTDTAGIEVTCTQGDLDKTKRQPAAPTGLVESIGNCAACGHDGQFREALDMPSVQLSSVCRKKTGSPTQLAASLRSRALKAWASSSIALTICKAISSTSRHDPGHQSNASTSGNNSHMPSQVSQKSNVSQSNNSKKNVNPTAAPQSTIKAAITTLLILGSYLVFYGPAILFQVLTCHTCWQPLNEITPGKKLLLVIPTMVLLILKSVVDPFIYSYRMADIRGAIKRFLRGRNSSIVTTSGGNISQRANNTSVHYNQGSQIRDSHSFSCKAIRSQRGPFQHSKSVDSATRKLQRQITVKVEASDDKLGDSSSITEFEQTIAATTNLNIRNRTSSVRETVALQTLPETHETT